MRYLVQVLEAYRNDLLEIRSVFTEDNDPTNEAFVDGLNLAIDRMNKGIAAAKNQVLRVRIALIGVFAAGISIGLIIGWIIL